MLFSYNLIGRNLPLSLIDCNKSKSPSLSISKANKLAAFNVSLKPESLELSLNKTPSTFSQNLEESGPQLSLQPFVDAKSKKPSLLASKKVVPQSHPLSAMFKVFETSVNPN